MEVRRVGGWVGGKKMKEGRRKKEKKGERKGNGRRK